MSTDCAESLTIYDSNRPDPARIIKTFCDTFSRPMEKVDFVSTGRSLYVRFESKTGSYSGSSLYYWAHYDFFNNTKFGDAVQNTLCDEIFFAWKHPRGQIRSPLNTLIYKRTAGGDVRCQYRFVTDKRLYARAVIEVTAIKFKEIPYNQNVCTRCHEERVDKLVIWEEKEKVQNHLACFCDNIPRAVRVISTGDVISLEMIVQGQHATTSYFKNSNPLFQATYEFAHGPLCGPISIGPSLEGVLTFPYAGGIGYQHHQQQLQQQYVVGDTTVPRRERCIWELKVAPGRDLWMHLDKARFADKSCDLGRIEIYLAGRLEPIFIVCPENASLTKDIPMLSAAELGANNEHDKDPLTVLIQYTGDGTPGRNAFRLAWTELFHLPRNKDGQLATSYLQQSQKQQQLQQETDEDCDFKCPGETTACIPRWLVCNGIVNCPNITMQSTLEAIARNMEDNLRMLGIDDSELKHKLKYLTDESPEICQRVETVDVPYVTLLLIAAGLSITFALVMAILCRMCRRSG